MKIDLNNKFILLITLQVFISFFPSISDFHGLAVLFFGLYFAYSKDKMKVIYSLVMLASSEIFYRQNIGFLLWEFPKYAAVLISALYLFKSNNLQQNYVRNMKLLPLLCVPSLFVSFYFCNSLSEVKAMISPFISGILALSLVVSLFGSITLNRQEIKNITIVYILGILPSIVFLSNKLLNISSIVFSTQSSHAFAGYGPIHVSTILGFGIGLLIITNFIYRMWNFRYILIPVTLYITMLMLLTFSRSGLVVTGVSVLCAFIIFRNKSNALIPIAFTIMLASYFVYPKLEEYTSGIFEKRFSEISPESRMSYIASDFRIWSENIIFGVGLGRAKYNRNDFEPIGSSHTEYTRFLAEQGLFGLLSLLIIFYGFFSRFIRKEDIINKPIIVYLLAWPILYFFPAAFRIFLPALSFGLAMSNFEID